MSLEKSNLTGLFENILILNKTVFAGRFFIFFTLVVLFCAIIFVKRKYFSGSINSIKETLNVCEKSFESLKLRFDDDSQYFRSSKLELFKNELNEIKTILSGSKHILLISRVRELEHKIFSFEKNMMQQRDQLNLSFFEKEKVRCKSLFYGESGSELLTDEQIKAVLSDDNRNIIIAGAGSGKTRVIDFKVRYLINYKNVSPQKIILLSFSRKSAGDLVKKISENTIGVEARTIHSFSLKIVGKTDKQFFDDSKKEQEFFVIKALCETLKEKAAYKLFMNFYEKFFSNIKPLIFYKSLSELRADLKKSNSKLLVGDRFEEIKARRTLSTLKGDYVRSVDERYIADFLFLQNINYEYEKRYPYSKESYYPDFYLIDHNVYLEHFALTSAQNTVPSWFEKPQQYIDGINWKRDIHDYNKTKMIESHSYLLGSGDSSTYLTKLLNDNGIQTTILENEAEVYNKISKNFSKFFLKFYNTFKMSGFSVNELKNRYQNPMAAVFLQLFEKFVLNFDRLVESENKIYF